MLDVGGPVISAEASASHSGSFGRANAAADARAPSHPDHKINQWNKTTRGAKNLRPKVHAGQGRATER
jgi:hypothetical protein